MWNLFQIELYKISKRPRTYISFAAITAIVAIFQFAFKADGGSYMNMMLQSAQDTFDMDKGKAINGYFMCYIILNTLLVQIPILVALVAGDAISGEANMGTLRLLLTKPISRAQIILVKFAASFIYTIGLLMWMAVMALFVSILIFGTDDMLIFRTKGDESQILQITSDDILWRYFVAAFLGILTLIFIAHWLFSTPKLEYVPLPARKQTLADDGVPWYLKFLYARGKFSPRLLAAWGFSALALYVIVFSLNEKAVVLNGNILASPPDRTALIIALLSQVTLLFGLGTLQTVQLGDLAPAPGAANAGTESLPPEEKP
ncbi:MAG: hypothetical protein EOO38_14220 [Cytophagaceae bacterium]|nr:MAG: hypothetical protein EOO38_14220 [Cytophagaceae bacterium]